MSKTSADDLSNRHLGAQVTETKALCFKLIRFLRQEITAFIKAGASPAAYETSI